MAADHALSEALPAKNDASTEDDSATVGDSTTDDSATMGDSATDDDCSANETKEATRAAAPAQSQDDDETTLDGGEMDAPGDESSASIEPELLSVKEIREFRSVNRWQAPLAIGLSWLLIIAFFGGLAAFHPWWLLLIGAPILGALQNRLTTLLHDAMHRALYPKPKVSDFLGKWFCSYPVGNFFHTNVIMHRNHHLEFGRRRDPNVLAYTVSRETFLKRDLPRAVFGVHLFSALLNFNQKLANRFRFSEDEAAIDDPERKLKSEALRKDYVRLPIVQLILVAAFFVAGIWWGYLYWVVVRLTWCTAFNQVRLFVEHHSDISDATPTLANTAEPVLVNTAVSALERFFIAPLHFNLHGTHHIAPSVPYYQLPRLTEIIRQRGLRYCLSRRGYTAYVLGFENFAEEEAKLLPIDRSAS